MKKLAFMMLSLCLPWVVLAKAPERIMVSNRILITVHKTPISMMDLTKRMTLVFHQQYPEYADSLGAKYQFFTQNWEIFFQRAVDNALVMQDATEKRISVTEAELQEKIEELFGLNPLQHLQKCDLSMEDLKQILKEDLILQKMRFQWVGAKARGLVHPQDIAYAYQKYLIENPPMSTWVYRVLSLRHQNKELLEKEVAEVLCSCQNQGFQNLPSVSSRISLSEELSRNEKEISSSHKKVVEAMLPSEFIVSPVGEQEGEYVCRIFYLKDHQKSQAAPFSEMEKTLELSLRDKAFAKEWKDYLTDLKERYGITHEYLRSRISAHWTPFILR